MEIIKKILEKSNSPLKSKTPTIAFLGDSVTQGCFELYPKEEIYLGNVCDEKNAYPEIVREILTLFFPEAPLNIIHAGVAGDNAAGGLSRLKRDVLDYSPDLVVVCFGLNDCCAGSENLARYLCSLKTIFEKINQSGAEIVFMTPNMMNTYVCSLTYPPLAKSNAQNTCKLQNDCVLDKFVSEAKKLCDEKNVPVCDCYGKWKMLYDNGVDTTQLLANKINHPVRGMHKLFAGMLVNTMFEN